MNDVLDDAAHKFKLFMRYQLRCHVPHTVYAENTRKILGSETGKLATVVMYYKMKFEHRKFRQKSSDWYGRKRMSWNGNVVNYSVQQDENGENGGTGSVKLYTIYLDHICKNDSNQTAFVLCKILELVYR